MRKGLARRVFVAAGFLLLLLPNLTATLPLQAPAPPPGAVYPNVSWALGVVVPQGAGIQGGGRVQWGSVRNVTAQVTLPNITRPDGIIYAVLSVMTSDRVVLQVAAGASADKDGWLAYSWCIRGLGSGPLSYQWMLNASAPRMDPNGNVSLSIFESSGVWNLRVSDADSGLSVEKAFPTGVGTSLKEGDQEVFALEAYTRTAETFRTMGNLTLGAVWLDGRKVVDGFYSYGQWDPNHSPVFIVGSSGSSPPSFIFLGESPPGSFFWTFSGTWLFGGGPTDGVEAVAILGLVVGALTLVGAIGMLTSGRRRGGAQGSGSLVRTSFPLVAAPLRESLRDGVRFQR